MNPTQEALRELEMLAARMSRDSRWQVTEAAFRLGFRLGVAAAQVRANGHSPDCQYSRDEAHVLPNSNPRAT